MNNTVTDDRFEPAVPANLYIYDHCPFCVRPRMVFGAKKIKHVLHFLANDDFDTPVNLRGKKLVPILKAGEKIVVESMDICEYIDQDPDKIFGDKKQILMNKTTPNTDALEAKVNEFKESGGRRLLYPRLPISVLPEFAFKHAKDTFVVRHPLEEPSDYDENMKNTSKLLETANCKLLELDDLIYSEEYVSEGGFSYDDIKIFPTLRTYSLVKGLKFPKKMLKYMQNMSIKCDIPLFDSMAI